MEGEAVFRVNGNQITMTAGDTALMAICSDEKGYVPTADDRAIFTVRERPGRRALIEKVIVPEESGVVLVVFDSTDTEKLREREYCWEVKYALDAVEDEEGKVVGWREMVTPMGYGRMVILSA